LERGDETYNDLVKHYYMKHVVVSSEVLLFLMKKSVLIVKRMAKFH